MWTLAVSVLCLTSAVLCMNSNEIRSSREMITDSEPTVAPSEKVTVNVSIHNNVRKRQQNPECNLNQQGNGCQGSKKRRGRKRKPSLDDTVTEKGAKKGKCVRSRDCGEGWCCVQYPGGGRCQRVLQEGEMCLLGGRPKSKSRRRLERCDCTAGLNCLPKPGGSKTQGECRVHEKPQNIPA